MNDYYDNLRGIRRSDLWHINKSPEHFRQHMFDKLEDATPTPSLIFGQAAHKYILEPESFTEEFAIIPEGIDRRTKEGRLKWAEFCCRCDDNNLTPISKDDVQKIIEMNAAIKRHPIASVLLGEEAAREVILDWTDSITGEDCKVKIDAMVTWNGTKYIVDYKTTDSCEPGHFERSVRKYGYKFQAGMYREGVFQNRLEQWRFAFVAQEKTAPYSVNVYVCSDEFLAEGYDKFRELIGIYHECKTTGNWYGYGGPECLVTELLGEG